jgi:hypothetical protein
MGLPASQRRALDQIEKTLADDHPGLGPLFASFTRLTGHEAMPVTERVTARPWPRRRRIRIRIRIRIRPGVVPLAVLALAIGALVTISLMLPGPRECAPGTVIPAAALTRSVAAGHQAACATQQKEPSSTSPTKQPRPSPARSKQNRLAFSVR